MINATCSCIDLSIIIPVYNASKYLRECMDSIAKQDSERYEVICIDDGSEDNSFEILKEYNDVFYNYRVIQQSHSGLSAARNNGLQRAKGEYVYFVDSDDVLCDNFIEYALIRAKSENLDVLMFSFENFTDDIDTYKKYEERILKKKRTKAPQSILSGREMMKYQMSENEYYPMVWIQMTKKKILDDNHLMFYEGIVYEDMLYTFRLLWDSRRVRLLTDVGYKKRIHEESICGKPECIYNVESLWKNYKELMVLCEQFNQEDDCYEYIVIKMIQRSICQFLLHLGRLNEIDRIKFINGLSKWDRVRIELIKKLVI